MNGCRRDFLTRERPSNRHPHGITLRLGPSGPFSFSNGSHPGDWKVTRGPDGTGLSWGWIRFLCIWLVFGNNRPLDGDSARIIAVIHVSAFKQSPTAKRAASPYDGVHLLLPFGVLFDFLRFDQFCKNLCGAKTRRGISVYLCRPLPSEKIKDCFLNCTDSSAHKCRVYALHLTFKGI